MLYESFVCPPRAGCPFHTTAKRYWLPEFETNSTDSDALTLLFLHSTSFHKESWEPTLHSIFQLAIQPGSRLKLREAWLLDCPNHGEAAVYNEHVLRQNEDCQFTCQKYASAVHSLLTAGTNEGVRRDFTNRRLVGIGHSLGANTILLLQQYEPRIPFLSLVIVEPMVSPDGPEHLDDLSRELVSRASRRRNVWNSREEARTYLLKKAGDQWDKRVVNLFVEYGLRVHPDVNRFGAVTLACTREQEAGMYRDREGLTKPVEALTEICSWLPTHVILGRMHDYIPLKVHEALLDPRSGRRYASIKYIDDVGHLVPQKKPDELASAIWSTLPQNLKKSRL